MTSVWKYISRNVREPLERRICCPVPDVAGKDVISTNKTQTKFVPLLANVHASRRSEETKCDSDYEKSEKKQKHRGYWRCGSYTGHTWIGAIGWSTALALSWNLLRPLYHVRFCREKDDRRPWTFHQNSINKHPKLHPESRHTVISEVQRCITPLQYEKQQAFPLNSYQKQNKLDSSYLYIWNVLSQTWFSQNKRILPEKANSQNKEPLPVEANYVIYGPPTSEEALNEAADNFEKVHNSVMGEIHNRLGIAIIRTGGHTQAVSYFLRAAHSHKHPAAAYNLGICFEKGLGIEKNLEKAASYYLLASQRGHTTAMYNLGVYYVNGWGGLPVDTNKAHDLFKQAASLGQAEAIKALQSVPEEHNHVNIVQQALGILDRLVLETKAAQPNFNLNTISDCKDISDILQDTVLKYTAVQIK